jgi:UDP-N-acetylmuramoylalanine--D-glutamate ligase
LAPEVRVFEVPEGDDVMGRAVELAAQSSQSGDVVLLAPAAASMDQFASYQDRGTRFAEAVSRVVGGRSG